MNRLFACGLVCLPLFFVAAAETVEAQDFCYPQAYRLEPTTVYERQTVRRMRPVMKTEMVAETATRYRPVVKTRTEMREITVPVSTVETSMKEERFTVWKPVVETTYKDETYTETEYVTETSEREEQYTTFRPVTETRVYKRQYAVQRPVTETSYYQKQYAVQRPVTETQMRTQQYTTLRPQTTIVNQTVDQGGYVPETTVTPGGVGYGLQYKPALYATPGPLGIFARVRGGNVVTPYYTPPTAQTRLAYRPNYVQQQVAKTSYMPVTEQVQVPVTVQRMQTEMVTQNVPVQTTRMETEMVTEDVPVQTTRMVPTTMVRKVPYVVQRPVTKTMTRKVPITQQRWVTEQQVRKVPVQTSKIRYETRKVPQDVQYTEYEPYTVTVKRPVTREVMMPYDEVITVPRQTVRRVPVSYYDAFSPAIASGHSSFSSPVVSSSMPPIEYSPPIISQPAGDASVTSEKPAFNDEPATGIQSFESEIEPSSPSENSGSEDKGPVELNDAGGDGSSSDLPAPSSEAAEATGASMIDTGWKIRYRPQFERSV